MKAVLSPAKTLDFESSLQLAEAENPPFAGKAKEVMKTLRKRKPGDLQKLQNISAKLAGLNYERNQNWQLENHTTEGRQAALAFQGDVYQGLEAWNWSDEDMEFASKRLLILSGLYGLLRPHQLILPYRLEMGTPLKVNGAGNLYDFWKDTIHSHFQEQIGKNEPIVNLASNEYFKAIKAAQLPNEIWSVDFKDFSKGKYKTIPFYAKKARGLMANFMVQNRVDSVKDLKDFNLANYYFDEKSSAGRHFVYLRDKQ